jgi:hypothetical protein
VSDTVLGLVVNPKLATPLLATLSDRYVSIHLLSEENWPEIGSGYYGDSDDRASQASGYPRSHTPDGVRLKKLGYGTCLYTALCLGAHQNAEGRLRLAGYLPDGDGICSGEDRSSEADDWWSRAKELGVAKAAYIEETEEDIDATSELADSLYGSEVEGGSVSSVNTINVDIEKSLTVDTYPFARAEKHHLVCADFTLDWNHARTPLDAIWKTIREDAKLEVVIEPEWVLALDVRDLTLSAMNLIGTLAEVAGVTEDDLHDLRFRWENGLDPKAPITQMRLPFKKNSSESRAAARVVERVEVLRQEAGWPGLRELP